MNEDGASYSVIGIGSCTDAELVIPATYNNLPVTRIDDEAFKNQSDLISVTIPKSVTYIGASSINSCQKIIWENSITTQWKIEISSIYGQCPYPDGTGKTLTNLNLTVIISSTTADNLLRVTRTIDSGVDYNVAGRIIA